MTRVFTSRTIPCKPLSGRWKLEHECFAILSCPKMYAASVPAPLARFVGSKQKDERLGNLARKGITIGEDIRRRRMESELYGKFTEFYIYIYIYIKMYFRASRLTIILNNLINEYMFMIIIFN